MKLKSIHIATAIAAIFLSACADFSLHSFSDDSSPALVRQLLVQAYEHMVQKDDAAAEHILLDARRLEPASPWVALNLGVIYQRRGLAEMARAEYRKALASQISDVPAANVSNSHLNGAGLKKIALHNLNILEKEEGHSSGGG